MCVNAFVVKVIIQVVWTRDDFQPFDMWPSLFVSMCAHAIICKSKHICCITIRGIGNLEITQTSLIFIIHFFPKVNI